MLISYQELFNNHIFSNFQLSRPNCRSIIDTVQIILWLSLLILIFLCYFSLLPAVRFDAIEEMILIGVFYCHIDLFKIITLIFCPFYFDIGLNIFDFHFLNIEYWIRGDLFHLIYPNSGPKSFELIEHISKSTTYLLY